MLAGRDRTFTPVGKLGFGFLSLSLLFLSTDCLAHHVNGVEVYNKYWTLEQQKEADKKIKQILQEGERLFVDPNFYKHQTTTSADAASQRKTL